MTMSRRKSNWSSWGLIPPPCVTGTLLVLLLGAACHFGAVSGEDTASPTPSPTPDPTDLFASFSDVPSTSVVFTAGLETSSEAASMSTSAPPLIDITPTSSYAEMVSTSIPPSLGCDPVNPCLNGGNCTDDGAVFNCSCTEFWTGPSCETDVDECKNNDTCAEFADCQNTDGGFQCTCRSGFTGDGYDICDDVIECDNTTLFTCPPHSDCRNTNGSYVCDCQPGREPKEGTPGHPLTCEDIDECLDNSLFNCTEHSKCVNTEANYTCECLPGFVQNDTICQDLDECENGTLNDCDESADCNNTVGSFVCQCKPGFSGDGKVCTDIDDCNPNPCENSGSCVNTNAGHYRCYCKSGWTGQNCESDIDECSTVLHSCSPFADCKNLNGSYSCACMPRYHGDGHTCTQLMLFEDKSDGVVKNGVGAETPAYGPFRIDGVSKNIFIHMNGYIVVGDGIVSAYPPAQEDLTNLRDVYAPFWSSIDTSEGSGKLVISQLNDQSDRSKLDHIGEAINVTDLPLRSGVMATWHKVSPLPAKSYKDKEVVTFQVLVVTDLQQSWVVYNYDIGLLSWNPKSEDRTIVVGYSNATPMFVIAAISPTADGYPSAYEIDEQEGNTGQVGRWVFEGPDVTSTMGACLSWYYGQNRTLIQGELAKARACPCTGQQAQLDLNYRFDPSKSSAEPWFEPKQTCNYDSTALFLKTGYPGGGYPEVTHPNVNQTEGWVACCENVLMCSLFYEVFPSDDCSDYQPPTQAVSWGDPHINTFLGTEYTFNGLGEYVLWRTESFEIQCRTSRALGASDINATQYFAFAMKEDRATHVKVEVRLNSALSKMDVAVNGTAAATLSIVESEVVIQEVDTTKLRIAFASGVNFMVSKGMSNLGLSAFVPPGAATGAASGLMAMTEDRKFRLRNGTDIPEDSTEEVLYEFGTSWQVYNESESLFTYSLDAGSGYTNFNPTDFTPTFYRDMPLDVQFPNETIRNEAVALCGTNAACLVDFAATNNADLANQTRQEQIQDKEIHNTLNNRAPVFYSMPDPVSLVIGEQFVIQLKAYDNDTEDTVTFLFSQAVLPEDVIVNETDQTSIKLTPTALAQNTSFVLKILAEDGRGGSAIYWPAVHVCACAPAECQPVNQDSVTTNEDRVYVQGCNCQRGYMGDFCTQKYDVCEEESPCYPGVNCTLGEAPHGQFTCGQCPDGLSGDGTSCYDVNECLTANDCEHADLCENLPGTYQCKCRHGFTLDENKKNCTDVDECVDLPCNSGEFCDNTEGSYTCTCNPGYFNRSGSCERDEKVREYVVTVKFSGTTTGVEFNDKLKDKHSKEFNDLEAIVVSSLLQYVNLTGFISLKVDSFSEGSIVAKTVASYHQEVATSDITQAIKGATGTCTSNCPLGDLFIEDVNRDISTEVKEFCDNDDNDCQELSTMCRSLNGTYRCDCKEGFKPSKFFSSRCDDVDECPLSPCGTATCTNTVGSYSCTCEAGKVFEANSCVDKCHSNPCKNGGSCLPVGDTFACKCATDWTGQTCEEEKADRWKTTLIIVASVVGSVCLIALIIIVVMCCRRRNNSKAYSGVSNASGEEESSVYQGWSGKIPRPKRTPQDNLEMVENGSRTGVTDYDDELRMEDPSKPLTAFKNPAMSGNDNPSFSRGPRDGQNPSGRRSNEYF